MTHNPASLTQAARPILGVSLPTRNAQVPTPSLVRDNSMAERFARKLESSDKASADEQGRADESKQAGDRQKARMKSGRQEQDAFSQQGGDPGGADPAVMVRAAAVAQLAEPGARGSIVIDIAMIDKIAARIAEVQPAEARQQAAAVAFPTGSVVESATVLRGPDGGLAIRITGLDPRVSALQADRLRANLLSALERRRIKTEAVMFDDIREVASGRQRDRDSVTSRVV